MNFMKSDLRKKKYNKEIKKFYIFIIKLFLQLYTYNFYKNNLASMIINFHKSQNIYYIFYHLF